MTSNKQTFVSSAILKLAQDALSGLERFVADLDDEYIDVEAWSVFHVWMDGRPQKNVPYFAVFRSWQFFNWRPAPDTIPLPLDEKCRTIADAYLKLKGASLPRDQREIISSAIVNTPDIYEIAMFNGDLASAVGCISRKKIVIYAPGLSKIGKSGDYLMAHAIPATGECHILIGSSQCISRKAKPIVQDFCDLVERSQKSDFCHFESLQSDFFNLFYDLLKFSNQAK